MVFDWATSGPYSGGTVVFIEYYRGWRIYFLTHWGLQLYGAVDPYGVEKSTFHGTITGIRKLIDGWIVYYPFTTILSFSYPTSLPAGAPIGELVVTVKNTGGGAGYLDAYIDSDRYTVAAGSSYPTQVAPGSTFTFYLTPEIDPNMPGEDYTLIARNYEGSSSITGTIQLELLSALATVKVRGICTGGYPSPSMLLEIYDKGVMIASIDFGVIVIGNWYEFETGVTGAGIHTVYGRMVLTNPLGSYEFTTPTEEFELG